MRTLLLIAALMCLVLTPSCYIERYYETRDQLEQFRKEQLGKSRRTHAQLKARNTVLKDSLALLSNDIERMKASIIRADSLTAVYTSSIRKQLGENPWGDSLMQAARAAAVSPLMNSSEEEVLYWLNLARYYPDLFAELYIEAHYGLKSNSPVIANGELQGGLESFIRYNQSCYLDMSAKKGLRLLFPDEKCFRSAECHAAESGKSGYTGHSRTGDCRSYFDGECCYYGSGSGLDIILALLVDWGVPSLGHRRICLGNYHYIGIATRDHIDWGKITVLDFKNKY